MDKVIISKASKNDELKKLFKEFGINDIKELITETNLFYHYYKENINELNEYYNRFEQAVEEVKLYLE